MSEERSNTEHPRRIRSYVLREGRLTTGQKRAFELFWPKLGVNFCGQSLDLDTLFGNRNPVKLEIGFGNGESLAQMAAQDPGSNYLGIEVHRPGVGHLLMKAGELGLTNIRVIRHDAVEVLEKGLNEETLQGVFLFFPDPWHKKRHHKRRILNSDLVPKLARVIRPGGFFHAATDWENYAEQMMQVLSQQEALFENRAGRGQFRDRPDYRPRTKFERRGQRLGHGVWDMIFIRR